MFSFKFTLSCQQSDIIPIVCHMVSLTPVSNLPPVLLTTVANLLLVSLTPVANLPLVQTSPAELVAKFAIIDVDTNDAPDLRKSLRILEQNSK
jgi:hypothetical protein